MLCRCPDLAEIVVAHQASIIRARDDVAAPIQVTHCLLVALVAFIEFFVVDVSVVCAALHLVAEVTPDQVRREAGRETHGEDDFPLPWHHEPRVTGWEGFAGNPSEWLTCEGEGDQVGLSEVLYSLARVGSRFRFEFLGNENQDFVWKIKHVLRLDRCSW